MSNKCNKDSQIKHDIHNYKLTAGNYNCLEYTLDKFP